MFETAGGVPTSREAQNRPLSPSLSNGHSLTADADHASDGARSSSLSDIEDGLENEEMQNIPVRVPEALEGDSEAETERVDDSPNKTFKQKNITVSSIPFEKSPSKLAQSTTAEEDLEIDKFSDSAISSPAQSDAALLSQDLSDQDSGPDEEESHELASAEELLGKKRKRSNSESDAESNSEEEDRPPRKRTGSIKSDGKSEPNPEHLGSDEEESSDIDVSREVTVEPTDVAEDHEDDLDGAVNDGNREQGYQNPMIKITRSKKGKKAKQKGRKSRRDMVDEEHEHGIDAEERIEELDDSEDEEAAEGEEAEDAEASARNEEEFAKKMAAMDALAVMEKQFAALRDRLYDERIASLSNELAQLAGPNPTHPEFLRQSQCVQRYRDEKFDIEQKLLVYKIGALKRKSMAERSQIHSAYFQTARDIRERHLEKASEFFYRIQRDRFKTDESIPNYWIPFTTRRSQQITQQTAYNKEVSVLAGVAKYVGFPAAPDVTTARQAELDEDMEKMGISANQVKVSKVPQAPTIRSLFPSTMSRPHAAEEQFLEQTPWANPQHPIHNQHAHRMNRQLSGHSKANDNLVTPAAQKHVIDMTAPAGSASTIPENPSAPASSAKNTPYAGDQEQVQALGPQYLTSVPDTDQEAAVKSEVIAQHGRNQPTSPSEVRKATATLLHNSESNPAEPQTTSASHAAGRPLSSPPPSRLALFSSPARPPQSHPDLISRHQTGSPMTLHPHARETSITAGSGFGRFGVR